MKKTEGQGMHYLVSDVLRWLIAIVVSIALVFVSVNVYERFKPAAPDEILTGTAKGMLSDIAVSIGIKDGLILTAEATEAGETPKLGGVAIAKYNDEYLPTLIGKAPADIDPSAIDTMSGATVTSNAFIAALCQAAGIETAAETDIPVEETSTIVVEEGTEVYTGSATGMGEVSVTISVADGKIVSSSAEGANETPGLGAAMIENVNAGFMADMIGKAPADIDPNAIDVVSGSTLTSKAVIEALTQALAGASADTAEEPAPAEEAPVEETPSADTVTSTGSATGMGEVTVTLEIADGKIVSASAEGASETPGLGAAMIENVNAGFMADMIGKAPADIDPNAIDVVSGSTLTSKAVIEALTQALAGASADTAEEPAPAEEAPVEETPSADTVTSTGSATGMGEVTVTLEIADGKIVSASAEGASETPGLGAAMIENVNAGFMADMIGKAPADVDPNAIDVVSGSTLTSKAVIEALTQALAEASTDTTEAAAETLVGSATGMGEVTVTLEVVDGKITSAVAAGASETPGLGAAMIENVNAGFMAELVGKAPADVDPKAIDVVSGSTLTSKAVIEALTQALGK